MPTSNDHSGRLTRLETACDASIVHPPLEVTQCVEGTAETSAGELTIDYELVKPMGPGGTRWRTVWRMEFVDLAPSGPGRPEAASRSRRDAEARTSLLDNNRHGCDSVFHPYHATWRKVRPSYRP